MRMLVARKLRASLALYPCTRVRIYDEATKSLLTTMSSGYGTVNGVASGHANRVFSTKFCPTDSNLVVSGGWDNTVQIWDIRSGRSCRSFYGPHICGDSLDVSSDGSRILTGSWRHASPLEEWDLGTGKLINPVQWFQSGLKGKSCQLYAAQYSKNSNLIAAGGSGANECRVFDRTVGNRMVGMVAGLRRGVFTLDFSALEGTDVIAIGGGDNSIRGYDVVNSGVDPGPAEVVEPPTPPPAVSTAGAEASAAMEAAIAAQMADSGDDDY